MAIFKCKICGENIETTGSTTVTECYNCSTIQTVPNVTDENLQNLFNRANTLRLKGEFDKAEQLYKKIIETNDTQAEAYWGLILCKYGVLYVDDPETFEKIPTCHRASYYSIVDDDCDYTSVLEYADDDQKELYEAQAMKIDEIQEEIVDLSWDEEEYNVFICYKETDSNGKRTQDSIIANDIYNQLTSKGFKVFYAPIALKDKLDSAYEPAIFAALNSANIMLVVGSEPEHFNSVWVKNEWSRFLKIMEEENLKHIVPCYRDMNAYELPEELMNFQAQNIAKADFMSNIVNCIEATNARIEEDENEYQENQNLLETQTILEEIQEMLEDAKQKAVEQNKRLEHAQIYIQDNKVTLGSYPQTKVTDGDLINTLNNLAGALPKKNHPGNWTPYDYYIREKIKEYMWYIDINHKGEKYRGVYFTSYRLRSKNPDLYALRNKAQKKHCYFKKKVYWFKYEPLSWRILSEDKNTDTALLLCDMIIDSQHFDIHKNDYNKSHIRKWLNETFYYTAFTELQKHHIDTVTIYKYGECCSSTDGTDKIFLLSRQEATNADYGFSTVEGAEDIARQKQTTDYAEAQGANVWPGTKKGSWWLRSPYTLMDHSFFVSDDGELKHFYEVYHFDIGVVPALKIKL